MWNRDCCEIDDLTCYDAVSYRVSRRCVTGHFGENDDLTCYDAVGNLERLLVLLVMMLYDYIGFHGDAEYGRL